MCYGVSQIRTAYDIQQALDRGITGKGRTIVAIAAAGTTSHDSYSTADLRASVRKFDETFHLPTPRITVVAPFGGAIAPGPIAGEAVQDVEAAHFVAPGAAITVLVPRGGILGTNGGSQRVVTRQFRALLRATAYAVTHNLGDVITQSYVLGEECVLPTTRQEMNRIFHDAAVKGITLVAASGDIGAARPACSPRSGDPAHGAALPAGDPLVTAVGGTTLYADTVSGAYRSEVAWDRPVHITRHAGIHQMLVEASGGGMSSVIDRPPYQGRITLPGRGRAIPDVAFDADPSTGIPIVWRVRGHYLSGASGGTSIGSPAWAGIVALADQEAHRRLGDLNPLLYQVGQHPEQYAQAFHDVTKGTNAIKYISPRGRVRDVRGYRARRGWDPVTGWGTPRVDALIRLLAHPRH